ncbi:hypothetical protein B0H17DRAFT_1070919 [Mycena rosella]|uniref:Uncharacterized protein n=1 Tax=Mycena rosella TaxID=1033263 RepID=A0AAD7DAH6_MYCRO|nr:hypothetical protein B0H17DRAFT_1070919 [Mycena rosella]
MGCSRVYCVSPRSGPVRDEAAQTGCGAVISSPTSTLTRPCCHTKNHGTASARSAARSSGPVHPAAPPSPSAGRGAQNFLLRACLGRGHGRAVGGLLVTAVSSCARVRVGVGVGVGLESAPRSKSKSRSSYPTSSPPLAAPDCDRTASLVSRSTRTRARAPDTDADADGEWDGERESASLVLVSRSARPCTPPPKRASTSPQHRRQQRARACAARRRARGAGPRRGRAPPPPTRGQARVGRGWGWG